MHEQVYKNLQENGYVSWDKDNSLQNFETHQINRSLKNLLFEQSISFKNLNVLDLGTGAGNCALFCAQEGAICTGVDISKTAIEMAKTNNNSLQLNAQFIVGDILNLNLNKKFDLITDSSLLHCLVGDEDRSKFYEVVKNHLASSGVIFIHTMLQSEDMSSLIENKYFHIEDEILYSLGIAAIENNRKMFEGKSYFPHRTILHLKNLLNEFERVGLEIIKSSVVTQKGTTDNFIGLLRIKE